MAGPVELPGPQLPWPAARRPLSVVAFANSVATLQLPVRQDRAEGTYVEVLCDLLAAEGVPAVPHLESRWFEFLHRAMRAYEERVRVHAPDVLVVQFGLNEYQPWLVPVWLIRHLMVQNQASTRTARAYRAKVAPHAWRVVRGFRRRASPVVGLRTWQVTPQRFAGHLTRLIRNVRYEARPLVLVLDLDEPAGLIEHFLPGMAARHAVYQRVIAGVVAEFDDPEVRLVRVSEITRALGPDALPDSMHYAPQTHRVVGEALAAEVLAWLRARGPAAH
ncbi:MAG: hypothetical protein JWN17_3125 [Frankiales bacterium]|nr:hypothetical protein [Frankiales bacterium]